MQEFYKLLYFKKVIKDEDAWDLVKYKGEQYAIPYVNDPGKLLFFARQDWLNNLELKNPENIEEFTEMLRKFTYNDPDGNGENDTWGLTSYGSGNNEYLTSLSPIFGAFGMQPQQYYIKDNKVYASSISEEYKAAIEYISGLYKEKLIDPEIFLHKTDQAKQKLLQGKSGVFCAWWSTVPQVLLEQSKMQEIDENVEWTILTPPIGENNNNGLVSKGNVSGTISIAADCKHPEAAMDVLNFISSDEGWELVTYGIKGVHYTEVGKRTEEGEKAYREKWLDMLAQIIMNLDRMHENWRVNTPANWPYVEAAMNQNLYSNDLFGITTDVYNTLWPDIKKLEEEWFINFVTGSESISKFDEYIMQWKAKGGVELLESLIEEYNERNNTNVTLGEQK